MGDHVQIEESVFLTNYLKKPTSFKVLNTDNNFPKRVLPLLKKISRSYKNNLTLSFNNVQD